jgi:hypothetical protein
MCEMGEIPGSQVPVGNRVESGEKRFSGRSQDGPGAFQPLVSQPGPIFSAVTISRVFQQRALVCMFGGRFTPSVRSAAGPPTNSPAHASSIHAIQWAESPTAADFHSLADPPPVLESVSRPSISCSGPSSSTRTVLCRSRSAADPPTSIIPSPTHLNPTLAWSPFLFPCWVVSIAVLSLPPSLLPFAIR